MHTYKCKSECPIFSFAKHQSPCSNTSDRAGSANTYNYMHMRNAAIRIACRGADKRCQTSEYITEPNSNRDQLVCSNETVIPLSTAQIIIKYDTE